MRCSRCQHDNPAGTKFCGQCAAPLASLCAACGAVNPPDNKFCGQCAAPLRPVAAPSFPTPESYTPKRLAEQILTSKAALEGERKQVTVLFADLKGSMELLADRDPEEARKLLDPVLERMMEAVHRYEGTVNQVMGDGIMALFGAPLAHADHAVRACYAALRMQEAVRRYSEELRRTQGMEVRLFWELTHSHRVHGWLILAAASVSYGKATAYLPVIELLRGYFGLESRDDPRKIREKVTGKVLTLTPALGPAVPAFLALLDVPIDEASWHALDPIQRRQQTLDTVKRLLLRESEVQPLVVVFEDLH